MSLGSVTLGTSGGAAGVAGPPTRSIAASWEIQGAIIQQSLFSTYKIDGLVVDASNLSTWAAIAKVSQSISASWGMQLASSIQATWSSAVISRSILATYSMIEPTTVSINAPWSATTNIDQSVTAPFSILSVDITYKSVKAPFSIIGTQTPITLTGDIIFEKL